MNCDVCDESFDCEEPCTAVIGWVDLPLDCRDKKYKPKTINQQWEGEVTRRPDVKKEFTKPLDFNN